MAATNPAREKHVNEVTALVKKVVNKNSSKDLLDNSNGVNQILGGLGFLFGDGLIDGVSDKLISRKNCIIFSLTQFSYKGEDKTIGIGILGNVIIFDDFEKEVDKMYNKRTNQ